MKIKYYSYEIIIILLKIFKIQILFAFLLLLIMQNITGQEEMLVNFSGIIKNQLGDALPNTHILLKNKKRGTISHTSGIFSIVVDKKDTILFSCMGYKKARLTLPDTLTRQYISVLITMIADTFMIEPVTIVPWKTYGEFKEAVINLKLKEERDLQNAKNNVALIKTQIILDHSPNPESNFRSVMADQYYKVFYAGQFPSQPIFNPFNWIKFIDAIRNGTIRDSRDLKDDDDDDDDEKPPEHN